MDGNHLVVFCSDGIHYVIDEEGNPDRSQPVIWVDGGWIPKENHHGLHNEVYGNDDPDVIIVPGSED